MQLRATNLALEERVRQLERQVSRNSANSSMPPSSDDLPGQVRPAPKPSKNSGRKRGKQPGAQGTTMPWVSVSDESVPHRPHGHCGCGSDLADAGLAGSCCLLEANDLDPVVYLERENGGQFLEQAGDVAAYQSVFTALAAVALGQQETIELIGRLAVTLYGPERVAASVG